MAVYDLFSKRQKRLRGELPDVYQYDNIPRPLRVQIAHIMRDAMGDLDSKHTLNKFQSIHNKLCREHGKFYLFNDFDFKRGLFYYRVDVFDFLIKSNNVEQVLDVVELYQLHITASTILFLIEAEKALP